MQYTRIPPIGTYIILEYTRGNRHTTRIAPAFVEHDNIYAALDGPEGTGPGGKRIAREDIRGNFVLYIRWKGGSARRVHARAYILLQDL